MPLPAQRLHESMRTQAAFLDRHRSQAPALPPPAPAAASAPAREHSTLSLEHRSHDLIFSHLAFAFLQVAQAGVAFFLDGVEPAAVAFLLRLVTRPEMTPGPRGVDGVDGVSTVFKAAAGSCVGAMVFVSRACAVAVKEMISRVNCPQRWELRTLVATGRMRSLQFRLAADSLVADLRVTR